MTHPPSSSPFPGVVIGELADGSFVRLRPVTAADKPLLAAGFARMSPRARYLRFLTPSQRLSASQLAYLTEVDQFDHVAWGVFDEEEPVGVGRWVRLETDPVAADVAVTVLDQHQRRGVGRLLLGVLAVSARARGVGVLHFDVLAENEAMRALLRRLGAESTADDGVVHYVLDVARMQPPRIAAGDVVALLERARRAAGADLSPGRVPD